MPAKTVRELIEHYARPGTARAPITLPHVHLTNRRWNLGPNEGMISQAWRVQVVHHQTPYRTRTGQYLDVQYVQAPRDEVWRQVDAWLDEEWTETYVPMSPATRVVRIG